MGSLPAWRIGHAAMKETAQATQELAAPAVGGRERAQAWFAGHARPLGCAGGIASAVLLWAAFPPVEIAPLVLVALVPVLAAAVLSPNTRWAGLVGLLGGTLFGLLSVWWLIIAHPTGYIGWLGLSVYFGAYWAVAAVLVRSVFLSVPSVFPFSVACIWIGLEFVRSWMLGGFPWFYLAHVFYRSPLLLQGCAVVGAYGASFLLAWINGFLVLLLLRRHRTAVIAVHGGMLVVLCTLWLGYGYRALQSADDHLRPGPRIVLVQTNVPQSLREQTDRAEELHGRFYELADHARRTRAQLAVWPETTWRHIWLELDPALNDEQARALVGFDVNTLRAISARVRTDLLRLVKACGSPLIMGLNMQYVSPEGTRLYNSALLLTESGPVYPPYHKVHLLPFGEYVPLERWLPLLRVFSPNTQKGGSLTPGQEQTVLEHEGIRYGPLICFEDTIPGLSRSLVREHRVDVLLNLTNDGWFGRSAEHEVHLAGAVFRAVECRRTLVRAVNTGISAVIDPYGRITHVAGGAVEKGVWIEDLVAAEVPLCDVRSPYVVLVGDAIGVLAQLAMLGLVGVHVLRRRLREGP